MQGIRWCRMPNLYDVAHVQTRRDDGQIGPQPDCKHMLARNSQYQEMSKLSNLSSRPVGVGLNYLWLSIRLLRLSAPRCSKRYAPWPIPMLARSHFHDFIEGLIDISHLPRYTWGLPVYSQPSTPSIPISSCGAFSGEDDDVRRNT